MYRDLFNADASTTGRQRFELHRSAPSMSGTLSAGGHTSMDQSMKDDDVDMKDYDDLDEDMKDDSDVVEDMKDDDDFDEDINNTPATDRLSHETEFSEGEIYGNIRYALQSCSETVGQYRRWSMEGSLSANSLGIGAWAVPNHPPISPLINGSRYPPTHLAALI
jgi:hypothetical protein